MLTVPRNILTAMLRKARGEYTDAQARVSVLLDLDRYGEPKSQRDYAKAWGWTRARVRYHWDAIYEDAASWIKSPVTTQQQPNNNPKNGLPDTIEADSQPTNSPVTTQQQPKSTSPRGSPSPTPPTPPNPPPLFAPSKRSSKEDPKSFPTYSFDEFWDDYGHKVGSKQRTREYWRRLSDEEKEAIREHVPRYVAATNTDGRYPTRCYPRKYINERYWESEPPPSENHQRHERDTSHPFGTPSDENTRRLVRAALGQAADEPGGLDG